MKEMRMNMYVEGSNALDFAYLERSASCTVADFELLGSCHNGSENTPCDEFLSPVAWLESRGRIVAESMGLAAYGFDAPACAMPRPAAPMPGWAAAVGIVAISILSFVVVAF